MTEVLIREAEEADLAAILDAYQAAGIQAAGFTLEEARQHFAQLRRNPAFRLFAAYAQAALAGTYTLVFLDLLAKRGARAGIVEAVAVVPQFQRHGVGRAMMEHARDQCRLAGCYKMALSSNLHRESAHAFYESLGFTRHGYSFHIRP